MGFGNYNMKADITPDITEAQEKLLAQVAEAVYNQEVYDDGIMSKDKTMQKLRDELKKYRRFYE